MQVPVSMHFGGGSYPVRLLSYRELAEVSAWIESSVLSPLDRAICAIQRARDSGRPIDASQEELLLDRADERMLSWPPKPGTQAWFEALDRSPDGAVELVRVILSKTVPGFDTARASALYDAMAGDDLTRLVSMGVFGVRPKDAGPPAQGDPEGAQVPLQSGPGPAPNGNPAGRPAVAAGDWGAWRQ